MLRTLHTTLVFIFLFLILFMPQFTWAQCENPTVALPDASVPVDGNEANAYCVTLTFDPTLTGYPTGLSLDLNHTWQGDLALWIVADGNYLSIFQRPGVLGSCAGGCDCGNSANLDGTYTFTDTETTDPEGGMALNGGDYGISMDDLCGVGTPGIDSFADLWATYAPGEEISATICISDHAGADAGTASDITFIFPNPVVCGCTDPDAPNFDPDANVDDGSCLDGCPDFGLTVNEDLYELCAGDHSFTMTVSAPNASNPDFEWTATNGGDSYINSPFSNSTSVDIPPDFIGDIIFTLTVTDEWGCEDFIEVEVIIGEGPEVEIDGPDEVCENAEVEISLIGGPFSFIDWNTGENSSTISVESGTYTVTVEDALGCQSTAEITIDEIPAPEPQIFGPDILCFGGTGVLETDQVYESYFWSNNEETETIIIDEAEGYAVTVTDINGCEGNAVFSIGQTDPVEVTITGDFVICEGTSALLDAGTGFDTYEWSNGDPFQDIFVTDPDTYSVTVTDSNGCEGTDEVELELLPTPEPVIVGPEFICPGDQVTLSLSESFSGYEWSNTTFGPSISVDAPGIYSVTVTTNDGCEGEAEFEILDAGAVNAVISGPTAFCQNGSTTLTVTSGYDTYEWSNSMSGSTVAITQPGDYQVTVTSVEGCEQLLDVTITENPEPTPNILGDDEICEGESSVLTLDAIYQSYIWSTTQTSSGISVNTTGTYVVTVTDNNNCSAEATFDLTVNELIDVPIIGPAELCPNASSELSVVGIFQQVDWSTSVNGSNITPIVGPGTYSVDIIDSNGCPASSSITVNEDVPDFLEITGDLIFCEGQTGQLSATPGFSSYTWSNNLDTESITVDEAGNYNVFAIDTDGCEAFATFDVAESPTPTASVSGNLFFCAGNSTTITITPGYDSYEWSNNNMTNEDVINVDNAYSVTVTSVDNCQQVLDFSIEELTELMPEIQGLAEVCEGESTNLSVVGTYETYSWSNNTSGTQIVVQDEAVYSVTVTDANGCSGEGDFDFTVNPISALSINGDTEICVDGDGQLMATAGFTIYDWSNDDEDTANITVDEPGTYSLVATDPNGCISTASFEVAEVALPVPTIEGDLTICPGASTVLSTPGSFASYQWSTNGNTDQTTVNNPGEVILTVFDDNGCMGSVSAIVEEVPNPTPTIIGDFVLCEGEISTLNLDDTYTSYEWSNLETGASIEVDINDTYSVTVTDDEGCQGVTSQDVSLVIPSVEISGVDEFCLGNTTDLSVPDNFVSYEWSTGDNGNSITTAFNGEVSVIVTDENGCTATNLIELTELPLPEVEIDGRLSFCPIGGTELTATTGYVDYVWSNNENTETIFINQENSYSVTVTDSNGCENSTSVQVVEDAELDPVIDGVLSFCEGTSTSLSVNADYTTYEWSNSIASSEITITEPDTYFVTVTDEFGCTGTTSVEVVALALPEPEITGDLDYCIGSSTNLNAGSGYTSYSWSAGGIDTQNLEVTSPNTYGVTVTDENNCVGSTSVEVIENPLPVTAIQGIPGFCPGNVTQLTAEDGFANYNWSTGSSSQLIEVGTSELITLTVTDMNGCMGEAELDVAVFDTSIPAIDGIPQYCPGEETSLTGEAGFVTYNWSTGSTENTINTGALGTITLVVTDNNNCETSNTIDLSPYTVIAPEIMTIDGFCSGNSADLIATAGYANYLWSNEEETSSITVNTGGIYELSVIDNNGCPSEAAVAIEEYALPEPIIGGSLTYCIGTSTTLNAGADYSVYQWSDGSTTAETIVMTPGTISLTVTDANGCIGNTSELVNEATELSPVISGDPDFCAGLSTELDAGNGFATYNWSNGNQTSTITVTTPGIYTLDVSDQSGCTGTATIEVVENPLPSPVISGLFAYCEGLSTDLSVNADYVSYDWNTGDPTTSITVSSPANYSVTVIDSNGCINETSQGVTEQAAPVFSIVGPTDFCVDSFSVLSIEPAYTEYNWSTADTTQSIQVSTSGIVGVTVTDEFGCLSDGNQTLGTIPLPLADAGSLQNLDCDTDLVSIGGAGTTSGDEFTYQWSGPGINTNNQSMATPDVAIPGMYSLLVTNEDYGCLSEQATVEVVDLSYVPQVVLEVLDVLDCATSAVQIDARDSDEGDQFVYQWLDGNLDPIPGENGLLISVNSAQFYTLQILDTLTGCDNDGTIEVEENELYPIAEAGLAQLITCGDPIVTLDGTGSQMGGQINYQWTSPNGFPISGSTTNSATTAASGWYFLEVLDELNGCSNIDSVFVDENTAYPLAFTSEGVELDCNVTSTLITSEGTSQGSIYAYQWFLNGNPVENATQLQFNAVLPGTYTLQVLNTENECLSTALTDITINLVAPQALEFITDIPTCAGDDDGAIFLTGVEGGTPPFLYSVGGAPFTSSTNYSNLTAGNYPITIEDATGCLLLTTVTVQDGNDLTLDLGDDQILKEGELADIYPEISVDSAQLVLIDWETAATLPCDGCIYQFDVEVPESMRFFLSIQDINGCETSDDLTIYVEKERPIYVPTAFSPNNDGENDIFHIYSDQSVVKINSFIVFNRWGESVFEVYNSFPNDPRWGWDGNYRGLPVNAAVYVWFAEVEFNNGDVEVIKGEVSVMR